MSQHTASIWLELPSEESTFELGAPITLKAHCKNEDPDTNCYLLLRYLFSPKEHTGSGLVITDSNEQRVSYCTGLSQMMQQANTSEYQCIKPGETYTVTLTKVATNFKWTSPGVYKLEPAFQSLFWSAKSSLSGIPTELGLPKSYVKGHGLEIKIV